MSTSAETKHASILFVCLGNICRSPMAEGVLHSLTKPSHPFIAHIDSCGTGAYHTGDTPDPRTLSVLRQHNITDYTHAARKIRMPEDFLEFDYLIAMDEMNLEDLRDMVKTGKKRGVLTGDEAKKIHLYGEFGGKDKREEIGDPYYGGNKGFEVAFEKVQRCGRGLIKDVEEKAK